MIRADGALIVEYTHAVRKRLVSKRRRQRAPRGGRSKLIPLWIPIDNRPPLRYAADETDHH